MSRPDEETGSTTTSAPSFATASAEAPAPGSARQRRGLLNAMDRLSMSQAISPEAGKYLEDIRLGIEKDPTGIGSKIKIVRLTNPNAAHAYISGEFVIVLLIQELVGAPLPNLAPLSQYSIPANEALRNQVEQPLKLLNVVMVSQQDFNRSAIMVSYITRSLLIAQDPAGQMSINDYSVGGQLEFQLDFDATTCKQFVNQYSPHSVLPRIDIGFVAKVRGGGRNNDPWRRGWEDAEAFLAVGAFVEPIQWNDPSGYTKYFPMIRITAIQAAVPGAGTIPLALAFAAEVFIRRQQWRAAFSSYGKNQPNIGNLSAEAPETGKTGLFSAKNPTERDIYIQRNMYHPMLALDIVEGQARIPNLVNYTGSSHASTERVRNEVQKFFDTTLDPNIVPTQLQTSEFIGTYTGRGDALPHDSREVDYLSLVAAQGVQDDGAKRLLTYYGDPAARTRIIADKMPNFQSLNRCDIAVVANPFINFLVGAASKLRINSTSTSPDIVPMDFAAANAAYYTNNNLAPLTTGSSFGYGQQGSYYQGTPLVYG